MMSAANNPSIINFREYLKIPSVHPNVDYGGCVEFLTRQAAELGLPIEVHSCFPNKPIVVITWVGKEPGLPSILLNSHMDVVPVFEEKWTHKPFDADIDENGNIFARGSQDMKCVGIQYLETIRKLKQDNVTLKRTIHVSFVPDEEIGGEKGMREFVKTDNFKNLNVGFALDEGLASPTNEFALFYGERCIWYMHIHCPGQPGHGSLLHENTAGEKVRYLLDKFFDFREQEKKKLKENPTLTIGDVTTVNLTRINFFTSCTGWGGVQSNVVPDEIVMVIDCRIPVTVDVKKWEETVNQWCKEAGKDIWIEFEQKQPQVAVTKLDDSNPFWTSFKEAADNLSIQLKPQIFTGGTDSRYVRALGIPAIGFSPINNTPVLLHDNDEFLNANVFLRGIDIYYKIIPAVANV